MGQMKHAYNVHQIGGWRRMSMHAWDSRAGSGGHSHHPVARGELASMFGGAWVGRGYERCMWETWFGCERAASVDGGCVLVIVVVVFTLSLTEAHQCMSCVSRWWTAGSHACRGCQPVHHPLAASVLRRGDAGTGERHSVQLDGAVGEQRCWSAPAQLDDGNCMCCCCLHICGEQQACLALAAIHG